jgi:hypothetical protein
VTLFAQSDRFPSLADIPAQPETPESLYQDNLIELHQIEPELAAAILAIERYCKTHPQRSREHFQRHEMFVRLNTLRDLQEQQPELYRLEHERDSIIRRRAALYAQHAELKKATGRMK